MGPQQQFPWYYNPFMMAPAQPFGQVAPQQTPMPQQTQTPTQPQQPTYYRGRTVESEAEIKPNEVPMDGTVVLFPKTDFSCIFGKTWTQDGVLKPMKFVQESETVQESAPQVPSEPITPELITDLVDQVVQNKLQSALEPITNAQNQILDELKRRPVSSSLVVPS